MNAGQETRLARELIRAIYISGFEHGQISEEELFDYSAYTKLKRHAARAAKNNDDTAYGFVIDHTSSLLKKARYYLHRSDYSNASIFFCMYFEHDINRLLQIKLSHKKVDRKSVERVMRLSLIDKITWVADVLELKRPADNFIKFVTALNEARNAYVHYKWQETELGGEDEALKSKLKDIHKNVKYFKFYTSRQIYGGRKKYIQDQINNLLDPSMLRKHAS